MKARARWPSGRIKHWRYNPPRIDLTCEVCRRPFKRTKSAATSQGQKRHYCGVACRMIGDSLWPSWHSDGTGHEKTRKNL
jgi:hypothetical protein